jgi:hypothetical protein
MPPIPPFLLTYGFTIGKVIWALAHSDAKALTDATLKGGEAWLKEKAKSPDRATTLDSMQQDVLKMLAALPAWEGTEEDLQAAASEAAETLAAGFTFDSLAENLDRPEQLPGLWSARRPSFLPPVGSPVRGLHDRLLTETARALVPKLTELPGYQHWLIGYASQNAKNHREL